MGAVGKLLCVAFTFNPKGSLDGLHQHNLLSISAEGVQKFTPEQLKALRYGFSSMCPLKHRSAIPHFISLRLYGLPLQLHKPRNWHAQGAGSTT